jgi:hypothetical protein
VSIAKAAVTNDPLCGFLAILEVAARLARRHIGRDLRQELNKVVGRKKVVEEIYIGSV